MQILIFTFVCKYKRLKMFGEKKYRNWLFTTGSCSVIIIICSFVAINLVHVSDVVTIGNASIIITAILCRIFLKEKLTVIHIIAFLITITGIVFISRPTFLFPRYQNQASMNDSVTNKTSNFEATAIEKYRQYIGVGVVLLISFTVGCVTIIFKKLANAKIHYAIINMFPSKF